MENESSVILLVDDKPANIMVLENLLMANDRHLLKAGSGEQALRLALEQPIDLVILDVQMPDINGFEVAQSLKSKKRTQDIPIIFVTAESMERQAIMQGYGEGAIDYLFKPLDPDIVKAKVSVLLRVQQQQKELKQAHEKIRQLNTELEGNIRQLEITNKELESFSYSVSHDLRAPLRILSGYSQILQEDYAGKLDEEARRLLGNIQSNAQKMGRLIDDLLEFSRLGRQEMHKAAIDMNKLVKNVLDEIHQSTPHTAKIAVDELQPCEADPALLRQAWLNLISNAVKYSSKQENPEIRVGSSSSGDEIMYFVKDNGAGFDMKYAGKLFGVFQRLHKVSEFGGTGVGLAIVQRVIARHGGRIWAEAAVNKGATFFFTLPSPDH